MAGAHPPLGRSGRNGSGRNGTTRRTASSLAHVGSRSSGRTGGSTVDEGSTDDAAAAIAEGVALWTECWSRRAPLAVEACPGAESSVVKARVGQEMRPDARGQTMSHVRCK